MAQHTDKRTNRQAQPSMLSDGNVAHATVQGDWMSDENADGTISVERRIIKVNGRTGRVDIYVEIDDDSIAIVEIKSTDWDKMCTDRVRPNVLRHIRQVYHYMESKLADERRASQTPEAEWAALWDRLAIYPGLVNTRFPTRDDRLKQIESICDEHLVAVVWQDETIAERKARSEYAG